MHSALHNRFLDTAFEASLRHEAGLNLAAPRGSNRKEQRDGCLAFVWRVRRKGVETPFRQLSERFARSIHAVTPRGFEVKIMLTVLALSLVG